MSAGDRGSPSLLDPEARGGDTAEGGFSFQENMLVARVPGWLRREGFSEMIREALGDAEARFFVPGGPVAREFVEYKSHQVTPAEFWAEVGRFQDLDRGAPGTYERFVLVCRGVSESIRPALEALRRVRDAYPFYDGADAVQAASYEDFAAVVEGAGRSREDAGFLFSKVWIESDVADAEKLGREIFSGELVRHFEECGAVAGNAVSAAFERVRSLVKARKNQPISRAEGEDALWREMPEEIRGDRRPVRILTATAPVDPRAASELVFQWEEFFGGGERRYPDAQSWKRVRQELEATRAWMVAAGRRRRISLGGSRRLSASLCIGSVFSAVSGFAIDVEYRGQVWPSDSFSSGRSYAWDMEEIGEGERGEMAVAIGILKDVRGDVARFLEREGRAGDLRLVLRGAEPLSDPASANAAVASAKAAISGAVSGAGARVLHLFVAGPAPFALFLGHRLNAVGEVQCYELADDGSYVATARFPT